MSVALLEFKSWPKFDEGLFESYVYLNLVVLGLRDKKLRTILLGLGTFGLFFGLIGLGWPSAFNIGPSWVKVQDIWVHLGWVHLSY